jgi:hypothetical protein
VPSSLYTRQVLSCYTCADSGVQGDVKQVIRDFALEVHCTTQEELNEEKIKAAVIKAGGANYMGQSASH